MLLAPWDSVKSDAQGLIDEIAAQCGSVSAQALAKANPITSELEDFVSEVADRCASKASEIDGAGGGAQGAALKLRLVGVQVQSVQ